MAKPKSVFELVVALRDAADAYDADQRESDDIVLNRAADLRDAARELLSRMIYHPLPK